MKSLQEKALVEALYFSKGDHEILKRMLIHTIDFSKLSEKTLQLIWLTFNDKRIREKLPYRYLKNVWWFNFCDETCYGCIKKSDENCVCQSVIYDSDDTREWNQLFEKCEKCGIYNICNCLVEMLAIQEITREPHVRHLLGEC